MSWWHGLLLVAWFAGLLASIYVYRQLSTHGVPDRNDTSAPWSMITFQLAPTRECSRIIAESWGPVGREKARVNLYWDRWLILCYAISFSCFGALVAYWLGWRGTTWTIATLFVLVVVGFAGWCDVMENRNLQILLGISEAAWPEAWDKAADAGAVDRASYWARWKFGFLGTLTLILVLGLGAAVGRCCLCPRATDSKVQESSQAKGASLSGDAHETIC